MNNKTLKWVYLAVLTALVAIFTMFIHVPIAAGTGGYANLGDAVILFGALLLGPAAGIAAAVGSALSDLFLGYAVYAIVTFIIKGAMGFLGGYLLLKEENAWGKRILVFSLLEGIMVAGYFIFECFCNGVPAAAGNVVFNLLQGAAGIACAMALAPSKNAILRVMKVK